MTDDDLSALASAYLDGEATDAELARVEDDQALVTEVERLRTVRAILADVPAARVSVREQQVAAALDAWERIPADRDATPVGRPRRRSGRRRRGPEANRWMLAAAAGLVVVLAGGLTLRAVTDRDDEPDEVATEAADAGVEPAETSPAADTRMTTDTEAASAEDASMALAEVVEEAEAEAADAGAAALPTDGTVLDEEAEAPPADDDLAELTSPTDLASFASYVLAADPDLAAANADTLGGGDDALSNLPPNARTIPPAEDAESLDGADLEECADGYLSVGPAVYDGVQVLVVIDTGRQRALAFDVADCRLVAQAGLELAD